MSAKVVFLWSRKRRYVCFSCDAATCGTTRLPRCWLWQTSTQAAKFWCSILVLASCLEPSWREWGVRQSCELLKSVFFTVLFFPSALCVITHSSLPIQATAQWSRCTQEVSLSGRVRRALASLHIFMICCMGFPSAVSMLCWRALWTPLPKIPALVELAFFLIIETLQDVYSFIVSRRNRVVTSQCRKAKENKTLPGYITLHTQDVCLCSYGHCFVIFLYLKWRCTGFYSEVQRWIIYHDACLFCHLPLKWILSFNITDVKQSNMAAEDGRQQPEAEQQEAEQQDSPQEKSMETSSGADGGHDREKEEKEKRREAKVCPLLTNCT